RQISPGKTIRHSLRDSTGTPDHLAAMDRQQLVQLLPLRGRRDNRQAVPPAAVECRIDRIFLLAQLHSSRGQPRAAEADGQLLGHAGVERPRGTAGPVLGQPLAEPAETGDSLPGLAGPSLESL